jgi:hypothetical protein
MKLQSVRSHRRNTYPYYDWRFCSKYTHCNDLSLSMLLQVNLTNVYKITLQSEHRGNKNSLLAVVLRLCVGLNWWPAIQNLPIQDFLCSTITHCQKPLLVRNLMEFE